MMDLVRLKGVRQDNRGTIYQLTKVETDGDTIADNVVESDLVFTEETAPAAPAANKCVLFLRDNGSGKTQLCARFPTGAIQQVAIEP
jgi:hypothetical protein